MNGRPSIISSPPSSSPLAFPPRTNTHPHLPSPPSPRPWFPPNKPLPLKSQTNKSTNFPRRHTSVPRLLPKNTKYVDLDLRQWADPFSGYGFFRLWGMSGDKVVEGKAMRGTSKSGSRISASRQLSLQQDIDKFKFMAILEMKIATKLFISISNWAL